MISPILLVALPLLAAFISMLSKKIAKYLLLIVSLANVVITFISRQGIEVIGGFELPFGINFYLDTYNHIGLVLVNVLFFLTIFINLNKFETYAQVLLVSLVGLNGLLLTGDLFNLFVFLEIAGISAYILTTSHKKPYSTFQYLVMGSVGSSLYLFGLIILYGMLGTLNLMHMVNQIQVLNVNYASLILPFSLMFIGLGVEAKLLPFNAWVKGILKHANTLTGVMIASIYAATILFVFGRLIHHLFLFEGQLLLVVTIILSLGIILSESMAFQSKKLREILLYSSISQASIVLLLFVNNILLYAVYLIVANAIAKFILFMITTMISQPENDDLPSVSGVFKKQVLIGIAFTIAVLSMIGLPLFVGFQIKLNFLIELALKDAFLVIFIILAAAVVEGIYYIAVLVKLWFGEETIERPKLSVSLRVLFLVMSLSFLVLGLYTKPLDRFNDSIDQLQETIQEVF